MKILYIATDAYGGRGGIARYTQSVIDGLCAYGDGDTEVVAIPRRLPDDPGCLPANLTYVTTGTRGRLGYFWTVLSTLIRHRPFDMVICGHILLMPFASMASRLSRCPCVLFGYGIDVWKPTSSSLKNSLAKRVDLFVTISRATVERFCAWSGHNPEKVPLLPPSIQMEDFGPGPKNPILLERYGLTDRKILMTLARLDASEQYKGFDEILEALPDLAKTFPTLSYLVVGDGDDRSRLERKARDLGVSDRVVFTGWIEDADKVAHYRLADAFAMPGSGEGFGIVYLEALACGIPVLGSTLDGSRDAVRGGELGALVDPRDRPALTRALADLLTCPTGIVPSGLSYFSEDAFRERLFNMLDSLRSSHPTHRPQTQ
ncbi:MAG: glycosyltransferase family 4 protein [Lentisphaeria bacterium]|nr:glycosyltransferase family 4 protein [Lentisphaeria bacterium]